MKKNLARHGRKLNILFSVLLTIGVIVGEVTLKLVNGGRWGIGMYLGMADRVLNGQGLYYAVPGETNMPVSAFYFPGGIFVALICRAIFRQHTETAMIVLAWICVVIMLWLFVGITCKIIEGMNKYKYAIYAVAMLLFASSFPSLHSYLGEWHPDYMVVLFAALSALSLWKITGKSKISKWNFLLILFLFLCGVFKQTSVAFYVGFALFILTEKKYDFRKKIFLWSHFFIAGLLVLAVIFAVPGCFEFTVKAFATHELRLDIFISSIYGAVANCVWVCIPLLIYYLIFLANKLRFGSMEEKSWFFASHAWMLMLLLNSAMVGANAGDVESGLVALLPFPLLAIIRLVVYVKNTYAVRFISHRGAMIIGSLMLAFLLIKPTCRCIRIGYYYQLYQTRITSQKDMNTYLSENYAGENVGYYSYYYEWLCYSDTVASTDFCTALHYPDNVMGDAEYLELYEAEKWPIIIMHSSIELPNALQKYYRVLEEDEKEDCMSYFSVYVSVEDNEE